MTAKSDHRAPSAPGNGTPTLAGHFAKFAQATALWTGPSSPSCHYSDTWQLVINTGTTFLIQNTQNRDTLAIQLKLSELVLAMKGAENKFASIEDLSDEELAELHDECRARAEMTLQHLTSQEQANAHKPRAAAHRAKSARRMAKSTH
jgi:low affinity Fe/Cu permease